MWSILMGWGLTASVVITAVFVFVIMFSDLPFTGNATLVAVTVYFLGVTSLVLHQHRLSRNAAKMLAMREEAEYWQRQQKRARNVHAPTEETP